MSLVARHLEANGLPTVVVGSAKDIVEHCGAPRFLFVDIPLGNPAGPPYDRDAQALIAGMAVDLLRSAPGPNTSVRAPVEWTADPDWRGVYNNIDDADPAELLAEGDRRRGVMSKLPRRDLRDATP